MRRLLPLLAATTLLYTGCRQQPFAPAPLPAGFAAQLLSGEHLTAATMRGSPWVVNLWLPT
jgi:hypothetical protein